MLAYTFSFYPRDAMIAQYLLSSHVRSSIHHKSELYQNGEMLDLKNTAKHLSTDC